MPALKSMNKIFRLSDMDYSDVKELLKIPNYYEFYITISNTDSVFFLYQPDGSYSISQARVIVTERENVIVVDDVGYAYATITVTVVK